MPRTELTRRQWITYQAGRFSYLAGGVAAVATGAYFFTRGFRKPSSINSPVVPAKPTIENPTKAINPLIVVPAPTESSLQKDITEQALQNAEIIKQEIMRLGIPESKTEQARWVTNSYTRSSEKLPINATTIKEAQRRVQATLYLMGESENPYLSTPKKEIDPLLKPQPPATPMASIALYPDLTNSNGKFAMLTSLRKLDGKPHYHIAIDINGVLNGSTSISLSAQLAHEMRHLKNMRDFQATLPDSYTVDERITKEGERRANPTTQVAEEAEGYGIEALAYIHQLAILDYTDGGEVLQTNLQQCL